MPRKPDARLEGRILDAAYRMWSKRGERALTMRAVARASGTTTPTHVLPPKLAAAFSTSLGRIPTTWG